MLPTQEGGLELARRLGEVLGHAVLVADRATDVYRVARRDRSLTLSAEMQWSPLPGACLDTGYASIAGHLEPAYSGVGDAYDWVADPTGLSGLLVDGAGYGSQSAGNATFTVSAVRNARREGADLQGMAGRAAQALFERHGGERFCSAVLFDLEPSTGRLQLIVAGTGTVVPADRHRARRLRTEAQPPLGVRREYRYTAQTLRLRPGGRVVVASDGVLDARVQDRAFGERLNAPWPATGCSTRPSWSAR